MRPESNLQRQILTYLRHCGFMPVHVPNGTRLAGTDHQRAVQARNLKLDGMMPGFPDIVVYASACRVGHLEVKARSKQRDTQIAVQAALERLGHHYAVCRSIDDVTAALKVWGWIE